MIVAQLPVCYISFMMLAATVILRNTADKILLMTNKHSPPETTPRRPSRHGDVVSNVRGVLLECRACVSRNIGFSDVVDDDNKSRGVARRVEPVGVVRTCRAAGGNGTYANAVSAHGVPTCRA